MFTVVLIVIICMHFVGYPPYTTQFAFYTRVYRKLSYCKDSARRRSLRYSRSFKVIDVGTN